MSISFDNCEKVTNNNKIVLQENKSRMMFENDSGSDVRVIEVDGCLKIKGKRCDYLVIPDYGVENFVELKGCNVSIAIEQLENSIKLLSSNPKKLKKNCFVISTRCPLLTPQIQKLKLSFKKKYNSMLIIKNIQCNHKL